MKGIGGHHRPNRGATDEWLTPPEVMEALGPFDLDPCAAPRPRPFVTAVTEYDATDNGLSKEWFGSVWLNPPYAQVETWIRRLAEHDDGIALVFARTETAWCQRWVFPFAGGILFLAGRLHFYYPNGERAKHNSGGPSMLVAYGHKMSRRLWKSKLQGAWVQRRPR